MGRPRKNAIQSAPVEHSADSIILEPVDDAQYYRGDKKIPKEDAQFTWTPAMVKELKRCTEDIVYFAEKYFTITNIDRGKETIKLYPKQKQALRSLANNRFVVLLASRQCGKSTILTVYTLWSTCFAADQRALIVANNENTAIKIFKKIRLAYELLPNFLKPGVKEYGKTGVTFDNDSSIGISTTTSTAARGDTASILCVRGDAKLMLRNKITNEIFEPTIEESCLQIKDKQLYEIKSRNGFINFQDIKCTGESDTFINIETTNGNTISVTPEHKIYVCELDEWVEAKNVKLSDALLTTSGKDSVISVSEQKHNPPIRVYDVVNTDTGYFFANNILIHNCIDEAAFIDCLAGDSEVVIKNKYTQEIKAISLEHLFVDLNTREV
jgi:hypothetical protein